MYTLLISISLTNLTREANLESDAEKQTLYESIRKTYIEAHKTPMINIDQIWKDYILFENVFICF